MLKKFILIFAFLVIAQAIAYCLPGDTVWVKNNVQAWQVNFSLTGDSIFCLIQSDTTKLQIRLTSTGNIIREFNLAGSVEEFKLAPNGRKLYLSHAYNRKQEASFINKPFITTLNLETGDTTIIIRSRMPDDSDKLSYYLYCWSMLNMSISKDEKYLTARINYNEYLGTSYGSTVGLFDIQNKIFSHVYGFRFYDEYAVFSPTENYFAIPLDSNINLINPETFKTTSTLFYPYHKEYHDSFILISSNSSKLYSYSWEQKIHIWNLSTNLLEDSISLNSQIENTMITPDDKKIIGNNYYWIWTVLDIEKKDSIYSFPFYVENLDFSKSMRYIVLNIRDGNLVLIETPNEITSVNENKIENIEFNIFPNPFSESATISYSLPTSSQVKISIYDIFGREVAVLADGWQEVGEHIEHLPFNIYQFGCGIYFCRIQSKDYIQTIKFVVIR